MARGNKKSDVIDPDGSIEKRAVKTGRLADHSIDYYENHTRDELIKEGYNKAQVEIANRVLAHFNTSVGAKPGRCPPEPWCLHPCHDCGATVDTRKINFPLPYGVYLCELCINKRNSERICSECLGTADDPAEEHPLVGRRFTRRDKQGEMQWEYLCTWCAIQFGHNDFFDKRGGTGFLSNDKDELLRKLRMRKAKDQWLFEKGFFDGEWEHYVATYTGVLVEELPEDPGDDFELDAPGLILRDQKDPRRFYGVCRIRVYHRAYRAYLEALFLKPLSGSDPSFDIRNLHLKSSPEEIRKIWKARALVWKIARGGGPNRKPEYPWGDESRRVAFIKRVDELCEPWRISLRDKSKSTEVLDSLWMQALRERKSDRLRGRIKQGHQPRAYALKQAAIEMGIKRITGKDKDKEEVFGHERLKQYYAGAIRSQHKKKSRR